MASRELPALAGTARRRLLDAAIALLDERLPGEITISDLVKRAGVSRPTFYAILGDLPTAFAEAALTRVLAAFEGVSEGDVAESELAETMYGTIVQILTRLEKDARFYAHVTSGHGGYLVLAKTIEFLADELLTRSPVARALGNGVLPPDFSSRALSAAITWTLLSWLTSEPRDSAPEMASRIRDLLLYATIGGLGKLRPQSEQDRDIPLSTTIRDSQLLTPPQPTKQIDRTS